LKESLTEAEHIQLLKEGSNIDLVLQEREIIIKQKNFEVHWDCTKALVDSASNITFANMGILSREAISAADDSASFRQILEYDV
jgi:hypothetical protein